MRALQNHLVGNPESVPKQDWVVADLAEMERILSEAEGKGVNWCLQVDF